MAGPIDDDGTQMNAPLLTGAEAGEGLKQDSLNGDPMDLEAERLKEGTGTVFGSIFNVANCAIGSGVLAFPWCLAKCGLVLGTIMIIFFAVSTISADFDNVWLNHRASAPPPSLAGHVGWCLAHSGVGLCP